MKISRSHAVTLVAAVSSCCFVSTAMAEKSPSLSQKMLKPVIEYQCEQELNASKAWKGAAMFMNAQQKKANQAAICECVGDHAMDNITAKDLMTAAVNETEKHQLISRAILNSLRGCAQQALN